MNQDREAQAIAEYVVGYCFREDFSQVVLIRKLKPAWQKGKLNGVGGKIEPGETPTQAMAREFEEEAGVYIPREDWLLIRTEQFYAAQEAHRGQPTGARVHHFAACVSEFVWWKIATQEAESVERVDLPLERQDTIYNLPYLVPMAAVLLQQPEQNRPLP